MRSLSYKSLNQAFLPPELRDRAYEPALIDAQAAAILNGSARAVKHILDHRACLDGMGQQNMPLIVMDGEDHGNISDKVRQMLIVRQLIKKEDLAFAFEKDHNSLLSWMRDEKYADCKKQMQLFDREMHGALSLKEIIAENLFVQAPLTKFAFHRMLLKNNIKVRFCDAAHTDDEQIDQGDPSSLDSMNFIAAGHLPASVSAREGLGMAVRNHHMAKMVMDFAMTNQSRIVFLQCGEHHVTGPKGYDFYNGNGEKIKGKDCVLSSFFKRAAFPSVAIIQSGREEFVADDTILVCKGLPEILAAYSPTTDEPRKPEWLYHIRNASTESECLNALLSQTGLTSEKASLSDWKTTRDQYDREISKHLRRAKEVVQKKKDVLLEIA